MNSFKMALQWHFQRDPTIVQHRLLEQSSLYVLPIFPFILVYAYDAVNICSIFYFKHLQSI